MAALSDAQLWTVVTGAGFTGQDALKMFAVALAESTGDPTRVSPANHNGTHDYGLFQINSVHTALLQGKNWQDPATNAAMAKTLYDDAGGKLTPWTTYNDGSYARYLPRAQAAAQSGGNATTAPAAGDTAQATPDTVTNATSGHTWVRLGMFAAGGLLVLIVAASLIKNTSLGKAAMSVTPVGKAVALTTGRAVKDSVKTVAGK